MNAKHAIGLATVVLLTACSGGREPEGTAAADTTTVPAPAMVPESAATDSAMNHASMPGMQHDSVGTERNSMPAMSHGGASHSGPDHASQIGSPAAGDHRGHTRVAAGAAPESHAGHAGQGPQRTTGAAHAAGHGQVSGAADGSARADAHAAHETATGAGAVVSAADRKLLELGAELVRDPAVQRRIQEDSALRRAWSDPGVRRAVGAQP